jgi:hypothetical protein
MRPLALAALAFTLALAGCGGGTQTETGSSAIPRSVADRLAAQSEAIAAAWDAGNTCGAATKADALKDAAEQAIAAGEVPAAYQDDLESAVVNLQNTANCTDESGGEDGEGPGQGHKKPKPPHKPKGHDKHDDDGVAVGTDTIGTTTAGEDGQ